MARVLILGDEKDYASRIQGKHYIDGNGKLLWHLLYESGLTSHDLIFKYCFTDSIRKEDYEVIIPLGQHALDAVAGGRIHKVRGSVLGEGQPWIIPTLHPKNLKKPFEVFKEAPVETAQLVLLDLTKAWRIANDGFEKPYEDFVLDPTIDDLERFVEESKDAPYLGVDLEGTGLNLDYTSIVCIGFASSRERAFVCPLLTTGGNPYWRREDLPRVNRALGELLGNRKLIFQNGYGYDIPLLRKHGHNVPWENFLADTMLLHHAIDPELPHNLGFISSVWGNQPYWKDSIKEYLGSKILEAPDYPGKDIVPSQQDMRRYNARDCTALIDIYEAMLPEVTARGVEHIVDLEHKLIPPVITMREKGLMKDETKVASWQSWLRRELSSVNDSIRKDFDLPDAFNFNSPDHLPWLLYGYKSRGLDKKLEKYKEYDKVYTGYQYACVHCGSKRTLRFIEGQQVPATAEAKCRKCGQNMPYHRTEVPPKTVKAKSRTTQIYKDLHDAAAVLNVPPLTKPSAFRPARTPSGKPGTGGEDIARYKNAVFKRQADIDAMKRPKLDELAGLQRTADFLERIEDLTKLLKLKSAFYDLPVGKDGFIHPQTLIQGTSTGRFSQNTPNLMQAPKPDEDDDEKSKNASRFRDLIKAPPGYHLLSCDYQNLEVNIGARFKEDDVLIADLEAGVNMHDSNTRTFFKIDKDNSAWKTLRSVSKVIQFARLDYGGGDRGVFSKVRTKAPNSGLTFTAFLEAVHAYEEAHPAHPAFVEAVQLQAKEERISTNGFGRVRRLYGSANSIKRQALNNPIQGTAADWMNNVMIELWEAGLGWKYDSYIALQVHDEFLFAVRDEETEEVYKIVHDIMLKEREFKTYKGNTVKFSIPIDPERGINWGTMSGVNLLTGEIEGGSKH